MQVKVLVDTTADSQAADFCAEFTQRGCRDADRARPGHAAATTWPYTGACRAGDMRLQLGQHLAAGADFARAAACGAG